jgi:hypothetical protein
MRGLKQPLWVIAVTFSAVSVVEAQTFFSIEGTAASTGQYNMPPPPCGGVLVPPIFPVGGLPCPPVAPFPPAACLGGTSVDQDGNPLSGGPGFPVVVNSDGIMLEMMTPAGAPLGSAPVGAGAVLPGLVSGVGCDSLFDIYYITDGFFVAGVGVPPAGAVCGPPPVIVPPFPLVIAGGPACGLAYDPCTATLWTCDAGGFVTNYTLAGAALVTFPVPVLAPPLTGISVNLTNGNVQVTDGFMLAEYTPAGLLAPPAGHYLSLNPAPIPLWAAPVDGLGFALAPVNYGGSCSNTGFLPTIFSAGGYSYAGNPAFTIAEAGASPGAMSFLLVGFAAACPPLAFSGCTLWVAPPFLGIIATGPTNAAGGVRLTAPLPMGAPGPCAPPVGASVFLQFINFPGPGLIETTDGLTFTIGGI